MNIFTTYLIPISMKKILFFAVFVISSISLTAQQPQLQVSEGDEFTILNPASSEFQYIHFPRKNFIIKRGAIPDMKKVYGTRVIVTSVDYNDMGLAEVTLERADGRKFFRHFRSVEADLSKALSSGELKQ